jgi:hypothetical protein
VLQGKVPQYQSGGLRHGDKSLEKCYKVKVKIGRGNNDAVKMNQVETVVETVVERTVLEKESAIGNKVVSGQRKELSKIKTLQKSERQRHTSIVLQKILENVFFTGTWKGDSEKHMPPF